MPPLAEIVLIFHASISGWTGPTVWNGLTRGRVKFLTRRRRGIRVILPSRPPVLNELMVTSEWYKPAGVSCGTWTVNHHDWTRPRGTSIG